MSIYVLQLIYTVFQTKTETWNFPHGKTILNKSIAAFSRPKDLIRGEELLKASIKKGSRKTYDSSMKAYFKWAEECGISTDLPLKEHDMCMFLAHRSQTNKYSSVSGDFSAIRKFHHERGVPFERKMYPIVQTMFKGLFRESGVSFDDRRPITVEILTDCVSLLRIEKDYDHLVSAAALVLAVCALLRVSEYAVVQSDPSDNKPLRLGSLKFMPSAGTATWLILELKDEKSAKSASGRKIAIGSSGHKICPIKLLQQMLHRRKMIWRKSKDPALALTQKNYLFVWKSGKPVTTSDINTIIKGCTSALGLQGKFTTHSCRIGGATSLAMRKVEDTHIGQLGRWQEMKVLVRYVRLTLKAMSTLTRRMFNDPVFDKNIVFDFQKFKF
ncbi:MAG: tyrosine-type recombinase/integrase [Desulfobacterales bacterium]|nr:tyrosine-type recombinase/integrase [Desulfobacterales bacterium]